MRYFLTVAEELHFGRAAQRLTIAQSAVSQQVRRLERELGVDLFDRTTRTVTLTQAGHRMIPHARAVLAAVDEARTDIDALRTQRRGVVRLGTSTGLGERLDRIMKEFSRQMPDASVELAAVALQTRLRQVGTGGLDVALHHGRLPDRSGLRSVRLWEDELVAAVSSQHPVRLVARRLPIEQLADLPLRIADRRNHAALHDLVVDTCRGAGFSALLGPPFTTDQDTLAAIATGSPSWTVYYRSQVRRLRAPGVSFYRFREPAPRLTAYAAVRPGRLPSEVRALLTACRSTG